MPRQQLVTVQVGQCGNQLGLDFFSALARESAREEHAAASSTDSDPGNRQPQPLHQQLPAFFRENACARNVGGDADGEDALCCSTARAVLLDAEPRVIANVAAKGAPQAAKARQWQYPEFGDELEMVWKSVGASGSANNWAFGYYRQGPALGHCAVEMVRREAEHCDRLSGLIFFQSLSGGTGSGAGSSMSELLRDEFPNCFMAHNAVWPSLRGEVVIQSYNAVLSLAHLLESTDALLAIHNDEAHDICQRRLGIARPSLQHLNSVIAGNIAEIWLPSESQAAHLGRQRMPSTPATPEIGDLVGALCASPLHKILSVRSSPYIAPSALAFSNIGWEGTLRNLRQMALTDWHLDEELDWQLQPGADAVLSSADSDSGQCGVRGVRRVLAHTLLLRGNGWDSADVSPFRLSSLYASWVPGLPLSVLGSARRSRDMERSAVLLSNSQVFGVGVLGWGSGFRDAHLSPFGVCRRVKPEPETRNPNHPRDTC
jgi:tubulin delta